MVSGEPPFTQHRQDQGAGGGIQETEQRTPITIDKTPVVGVHITEDLTWSVHTDAVLKKAHQRLFFLRWLRKFGTSPSILRSFYTFTVQSILTSLLSLLPSGRCLHSVRSHTSRLRDSSFPQAIRLMNSKN